MDETNHEEQAQPGHVGDEVAPDPPVTADAPVDRSRTGWILAALIVGLGLIATQVLVLLGLSSTRGDIEDLNAQVAAVDSAVGTLTDDLSSVAADVESAEEGPVVEGGPSSAIDPPVQTAPAGYLPRYEPGVADRAVGMSMGTIEGIDGYDEVATSVDPADGTRRVWMIWAHWCPHCQAELPELDDWYPTANATYEAELVTVSTSIDPTRGNPLPEYLAAEQFPFPVVVDADNQMAVKMGVSAFPFWVVTDGDGEVLLRTAGRLSNEQVTGLFEQLDALDS